MIQRPNLRLEMEGQKPGPLIRFWLVTELPASRRTFFNTGALGGGGGGRGGGGPDVACRF